MTYAEHIRNKFEHQFILAESLLEVCGINNSRTNPARFESDPSLLADIVVLFKTIDVIFTAIEMAHKRILLLYSLEEGQDGIPAGRQI